MQKITIIVRIYLKLICKLFIAIILIGCSQLYNELESAFGTSKKPSGNKIASDQILITSRNHPGISKYDMVEIKISKDSIDIEIKVPFTKMISIPKNEIAECGMTCFGCNDPYVDILIPKTGTDISIKGRKEMTD